MFFESNDVSIFLLLCEQVKLTYFVGSQNWLNTCTV